MMNEAHYGLYDTVLAGPPTVPYSVGWALWGFAIAVRIGLSNLKIASGQSPEWGKLIEDVLLASAGLAGYAFICDWIWAAGQILAYQIYPDEKMEALGKLLAQVSQRFRDYSFTVLDVGKGLKDGAVVLLGIASWLLALIGHYQLQGVQCIAWNILYCFGPLLIGGSVFGIQSGRIWISGVVQISLWSVANAVVYDTIAGRLEHYLVKAKDMPLMDTSFIDVIGNLLFLGLLPVFIPGLVAYFVGSSIGSLLTAATAMPVMTSVGAYVGAKLGVSPHSNSAKGAAGAHTDGSNQKQEKHSAARPFDL